MASVLKMPRLSDTMVEGVLVRWLKKVGDTVQPGDILAEVETDKATMDLEAFEDGIVRKLLLGEGQAIPVGGAVAILAEDEDEDISGVEGSGGSPAPAPAGSPQKASAAADKGVTATVPEALSGPSQPEAAPSGRIRISPLARKMAAENRVDIRSVVGSGPGGRVIRRDIERAVTDGSAARSAPVPSLTVPSGVTAAGAPTPGQHLPLTQMRKAIARRMTEAKLTVPHFYLTSEVDMGKAMDLREQLNQAAGGAFKVSVNDMVMKACAAALLAHPKVNASFDGDHLILHEGVHMGFAAAVEDGLITPVIRDCHRRTLGQIARESRALAEAAMGKKLKPEDYSGATFTVSNLGMFGIVEFVAIINPPQAAILAVGSVREIPVVETGQLTIGKRMRVTLSCDHRVLDGAQGAQFLATFRETMEHPLKMLL